MAFEAVPGDEPPKVRMPAEPDSVQVEHFALRPVRREKRRRDRGDVLSLGAAELHSNPRVLRERVEVVHDVESRDTIAPVDGRHVHAVAKILGLLQVAGDVDDALARDGDRQLSGEFLRGRDAVGNGAPKGNHPGVIGRVRRGGPGFGHQDALRMTFILSIFFWSWMIPYRRASGLGGQPGTYTSTGTIRSTPC